jgi:predicted  nucleic acid-binding Zn-ribbon protein
MKSFRVLVAFVLVLLISLPAAASVSSLQKEISAIDASISARKAQLAGKNAGMQNKLEGLEKELRSSNKRLDRHNRKIERADERFSFVQSEIKKLDKWYNGLGAIDQGLNSGTYDTKKNALNVDKETAQSELRDLTSEQKKLSDGIASKQGEIDKLKSSLSSSTKTINSDKKIKALRAQKAAKQKELAKLKAAVNAKPKGPVYKTYVYAISSKKTGELEKSLKLKKWVESYKAKYVEANWNDLTGNSSPTSGSMIKFMSQIDQEFKQIPSNSKVILIGYGLGGGAAVLAATEVAKKRNRTIDFLVTIDPMGPGDSRMNAVYETEAYCQGRISPEQYLTCLDGGKKRLITKNVKSFYNRWQRESKLPIDAKDRMTINKKEHVLSTGKFLLESSSTEANQKRMYYDDKNAHKKLLSDAATELPKILVTHLR